MKTIKTPDLIKQLFCIGLLFMSLNISAQDSTEFVTVDNTKFHIKLGGLEHVETGVPIVVLEMGAGSTLKSWDPIFNDLTKFAPVFAYERSGIGQSEWNSIEPTPANVVNQLKKILYTLDLKPPYILAGHSWGGVIIRTYAGHFKDDVKAMVYIDPMDYEMTVEEGRKIYSDINVDPDKAKKFVEDVTNFYTSGIELPPGISAEYEAIDKYDTLDISDRQLGEEPNLPMVVFIGTKYMQPPPAPPQFEQPFDNNEWFKSSMKQRIASLSKWPYEYSEEGYLFVSPKATHYFHFGEPEMVLNMIKKFTE